jgi:TPR repeat protein
MRARSNGSGLTGVLRRGRGLGGCGLLAGFAASLYLAGTTGALALDGSPSCNPPTKVSPQTYTSASEALNAAVKEMRTGDPKCSVQALTYAAEGGEPLARWTLGSMYAAGQGVPRDEVRAYKYFEQVVDSYNEDDLDTHDIGAVSRAFVAVGEYNLTGIPNSDIKSDPERALEMFQFAATNFRDPQAQFHLGRMYLDGSAGLARDKMRAARWFGLAAEKGHAGAQALLGHLLFQGDGVPRQRGRGLMLLSIAMSGANAPNDAWIHDLHAKDYAVASDEDREAAAAYMSSHGMRDLSETAPHRGGAVVAGSTNLRPPAGIPGQ